jgi:hypothetical protein
MHGEPHVCRPPDTRSLGRCGMRENVTKFVNDFLPDLIFKEIVITRGTQHSRLQDLMLLAQQCIEFESHFLSAIVFHDNLG